MSTQPHTPFWISEQSRPLMRVLATLGGVISAILTVQFCVELGGRGVQLVPVMLGIFCEGLKFAAVGSGLWLIGRGPIREQITGWASLCLAAVLILGSVTASMGYLGVRDAQGRSEAWQESSEYAGLRHRQKTLEGLLSASQATAEEYRARGYITRGTSHDRTARAHAEELQAVLATLAAKESSLSGELDFFAGLAALLDSETRATGAQRLRSLSYLVIAVVLEAGCVLAIQLLTLNGSHNAPAQRSPGDRGAESRSKIAVSRAGRSQKRPQPIAEPQLVPHEPDELDRDEDFDTCYHRVRSAVIAGNVKPAYRPLRTEFSLRQQTVRALFRRMEDEGVVVRAGKGFALPPAGPAIGFSVAG